MRTDLPKDDFLEKRMAAYDKWLARGEISYSSRVIPVAESFSPEKWVLPSEQAMTLLREAAFLVVHQCLCRSHYKRCDHPVEVCLLFNDVAKKAAAREGARPVTPEEAAEILKVADKSGLVHLSLYMPDHQIYAICSCCSCCCHDLQIVKKYNRPDLMVRSQYRAVTVAEDCILCGDCVGRCPFEARQISKDDLVFDREKCLGCGLCVSACPGDAVFMTERGA